MRNFITALAYVVVTIHVIAIGVVVGLDYAQITNITTFGWFYYSVYILLVAWVLTPSKKKSTKTD